MVSKVNSQPQQRAGARRQELPALATGVAAAIDLVAAALLIAGPVSWGVCGLALALHLIATGSLMRGRRSGDAGGCCCSPSASRYRSSGRWR